VAEQFRFRSLRQWDKAPERVQHRYLAALENLNTSRVEHRLLREVVNDDGRISMSTQMRYTRSATRRDYAGRIVAKDADRLFRPMEILSAKKEVLARAVYGSRSAAEIAAHESAVDRFLETGDERHLAPFRGHRRAGVELATDPAVVEQAAREGILDDLTPYIPAAS